MTDPDEYAPRTDVYEYAMLFAGLVLFVALCWGGYQYKLWSYDECLQVGHTKAMCEARFWLSR